MPLRTAFLSIAGLLLAAWPAAAADAKPLDLKPHDTIVLIGNTLAERESDFGRIETMLHARFPEHDLVVRNLGWSADTVNLRLRSQDFPDHGHTLVDHDPDVIFAFFGFNESFAGPARVEPFKNDLKTFLIGLKQDQYPVSNNGRKQDAKPKPDDAPNRTLRQVVLFSPIAQEEGHPHVDTAKTNNENLELYSKAMQEVAAAADGVTFVDLFSPSQAFFKDAKTPLTINGVHLNDAGYIQLAGVVEKALVGPPAARANAKLDPAALHAAVLEKNKQFWFDYRAVNGFYIYGGRKNPFGVVNFPAEFAKLRKMVAVRDERIWKIARGEQVPATIDDSGTGEFTEIKSNVDHTIELTTPAQTQASFKLAPGFKAELFADEATFPDLRNPVGFSFDGDGRMWVCTMESYPMYLPGTPPDDKILILEDTDGDGKADKSTVFADGLHLPTGLELGDGGVYVAQQPNLVFLKDTDGDDKADEKTVLLGGFDSADSHHAISAFTWGPGGGLYFQEGTFHHSQIETPYGPVRLANAGTFRFEPTTWKLGVFISYGFANPWGHCFDRWGQDFLADASGGANYFATAFSGDVDFPRKHGTLKQFLNKQWRPTSGCEIVSSRNFPDEMQGDYLLNNVIGFHGVLDYRMQEDGSGFKADPVEPLLQAGDTNFRPVDLEFGPDGALYLCDWFNPLIGHMQHSVRDPQRDANHGRIWRVWNTNKPLVETPKFQTAEIPALLDLLKSYEDRTRYRARAVLRGRDPQQVLAALDQWTAKLDKNGAGYWHDMLEALWLKQSLDAPDPALLTGVLNSPEPKARAAATRVLGYWRDRVTDPLALLTERVNDDNPRVRLEAVRALSFFDSQAALDVAVESLVHPQDDYLEYTLNETVATLEGRVKNKK